MAGPFGAFGKIPALGDFFRMNVSQGFVEAWDEWLQAALLCGRVDHGSDWTERYMSAPIWRFALSPGYAGQEAVIGVMMPSVDRVGRQFPLTLVAPAPTDAPMRTLAMQEAALSELELIALDALDDDMTREELARRLEAVQLAPRLEPSVVRTGRAGIVVSSSDASAVLPDLALRLGPIYSTVFATAVEGQARLMTTHSMPGNRAAAALFDIFAPIWSEGFE
ncbi:type VI secretion system-associated protein TagF [Frigidibacter sp. ROC022]|uniref:type VI secretion system-associated protein TagF n=1 Tax=Frigidibacter sp. ROC022 TaxID=2971796 RepID=UPI00215B7089|nr:type VI secretion system-associated protein TagF [Frigidibacter sp. ROC022]MCR8723341.1 type VI secretion system-associated protein TagF [Frigidibacter sp. ROC022]